MASLFQVPQLENLWDEIHHLTYRPEGLGGYGYGLRDVLAMTPAWFRWAVERQTKARESEIEARKKGRVKTP